MTENKPDTGQISVAELLARNGKKVDSRAGGRRRRGNSGGISVAELTGEIPVVHTPAADPKPVADEKPAPAPAPAPKLEPVVEAPRPARPQSEPPKPAPAAPSGHEAEPVAAKPAPVAPKPAPVAPKPAPVAPKPTPVVPKPAGVAAEPRVVAEDAPTAADTTKVESPTEVIRSALPRRARAHLDTAAVVAPVAPAAPAPSRPSGVPEPRLLSGPASDLRGTGTDDADSLEDTDMIGGAVAADPKRPDTKSKNSNSKSGTSATAAVDDDTDDSEEASGGRGKRRRGRDKDRDRGKDRAADADSGTDEAADADDEDEAAEAGGLKQWAMLAGESIAAIVAGALLFKGFERMWDSLPWVAFALALLVIVGLVAVVRILRRTDDITSQLIALAVGAFVTFGPLLFLLPNG